MMSRENQEDASGSQQSGKHFGLRRIALIQLVEGRMEPEAMKSSSVTLVRTPTSTVVIDTGSRTVSSQLKESLRARNVNQEKVNVLVTTRADPYHTGNDGLFVHALQHVKGDDWSKVGHGTGRRIAITNRFHWIDRYLELVVVPFPEPGTLVLLVHLPKRTELLESETRKYAGQVIGIAGTAVPSGNDPAVREVLGRMRGHDRENTRASPGNMTTLEDLLAYCDQVVPGYGAMFEV